MNITKQYEESCIYDDAKALQGHAAINPQGHLVQLPPGSISPSVEMRDGQPVEYIDGLKEGWKLAKGEKFKSKAEQIAEAKAKAPPAKAEAKPAK